MDTYDKADDINRKLENTCTYMNKKMRQKTFIQKGILPYLLNIGNINYIQYAGPTLG